MTVDESPLIIAPPADRPARRIARNAGARAIGEIIGKVVTVAVFIVAARRLGPTGFGDITFALALAGVLIVLSELGTDWLLAREVARDRSQLGSFMGNVLAIKVITAVPALLIAAAVVELGGYAHDARVATYLIAVSVLIDNLENTWNAAFQAHERLVFVSATIVLQRIVTGGLVLGVLAAGAGVVPVSGMFLIGSVATILLAMWLLRFVASPTWSVEWSRFLPIIRAGIPIGLIGLLFTILLKADVVLLSLLKGADNHEVGLYGSGYRLVESTMFLSWSFGAAMLPWLSRQHVESRALLARGYEIGLKVLVALLVPIAVAFALLARPMVHALYGARYDAAVTPLRVLSLVVVFYGVNHFSSVALTAHDRPGLMNRLFGVAVVQNIATNVILIPPYGATGAAVAAASSGLCVAALSIWQIGKVLGGVNPARLLAAPLGGAAVMTAVVLLGANGSLVPGLVLGGLGYAIGLVVVERTAFPDDFSYAVEFLRSLRAAASNGV